MFDQLTYKKKNILLGVGVLLFSIIAYYFSVAETIELMQQSKTNRVQLEESQMANEKIAQLESKLSLIDNKLGSSNQYQDFQQILLERVSTFCEKNQLNLSKLPKPFTGENDNYLLQTFQFEVEGPFKLSLQLIYLLEEEWKLGKSISVNFEVKKNYKTNTKKLYTSLYLQSIKAL